jgi:hypothetical protein
MVPGLGNVGDGGAAPACAPSPANYDIPGNNCDDDGDGKVDNVTVCDQGLAVTGAAADFVKSLGLCQAATGSAWGVVSAAYTSGYKQSGAPNDGQHGILPKFGDVVKPREGQSFGVLSSGWAREWDDQTLTSCDTTSFAGCFKQGVAIGGGNNGAPPGFPKKAGNCDVATDTHDVIDLKIQIKVPANAQGFQFDFDFWTGEWPEYVCTTFNDGFVAFVTSTANKSGGPENVSFDPMGNPVSVNNDFFDRCTDGATTGCTGSNQGTSKCPGGTAELAGTGFLAMGTYCPNLNPFGPQPPPSSGGGATGWLTTQAPAKAGETITLEYIIWDTGDSAFDSSVVVDNFQWAPGPVTTGTQRPPR